MSSVTVTDTSTGKILIRGEPTSSLRCLSGYKDFKFTPYFRNRMGGELIYRGKWPTGAVGQRFDGRSYALSFWDCLDLCEEVDCYFRPCRQSVAQKKSGLPIDHKYCLLQKQYLRAVIAAGLSYIEETGPDWRKVLCLGHNLVPLYNILWRCKMEMLKLRGWVRDPEHPENVHPVYTHFQDTLDRIEKCWVQLGRKVRGGHKISPPTDSEAYINALLGKKESKGRRTRNVKKELEEGRGMRWD